LFLRARDAWPLHARALPGLVCEQGFRPSFDALQRSGLEVSGNEVAGRFPLVLVLPPRQRDEARALLARAVEQSGDDGIVLACMPNDEGAKSGQSDLARLVGPVSVLSKQHCRVFWSGARRDVDHAAREWRTLDAPRPVAEVASSAVPACSRGIASTGLRLAGGPPAEDLAGEGADLGAGTGYLALEVSARCPRCARSTCTKPKRARWNWRAHNLAQHPHVAFHWHDVTQGLPRAFDFIVSNPPFHAHGRADRPDIGARFITAAAEALRPARTAAAGRQPPSSLRKRARRALHRRPHARGDRGFKVIEAVRA
jgi:16S rRNA (guanine1207-N2)-methyltransferase